jgi:hypothetical protein
METNKQKKCMIAIIAGIMFSAMMLNTLEEISPTAVMGNNLTSTVDIEEEIEIVLDTNTIQEKIVEENVSTRTEDVEHTRKVENIRRYLQGRKSPLAEYAEEFVNAANEYGIDYRLVASISIIESSGGIHNFRPYNAWGWGKSGFSNWKEGIWAVSKGLGKYYARGLTTPQKIAPVYCPPSASSWASKVTFVMNQIGN